MSTRFSVTLGPDASLAFSRYIACKADRPATDKDSARQREELRSYAVEVVNGILHSSLGGAYAEATEEPA